MKHFLLLVMLFVAGNLFATDYYVSDSTGDNTNDGLTEGTAWKTLSKLTGTTFSPGDVIHLKRGDVWYGQSLTISSSGEAGNPITYTSYGTGDLPEVCAMATFDNSEISWTNKGSNIWEATINAAVIGSTWNQYFNLERLYINDSEVLGTPTVGNVGTTVPDRVVFNYNKSTQLLTLYSTVDPSTLKIECSYAQFAVSISHIEYVDIENIKITGGNIYGINLRASKNINLTNIDIGEAAYTAVYIGDISDNISEDIVFDNCTFDGNYNFDFSASSSYNRGPKYGISGRFSDNIEIKNSIFNNFTNASLRLEDYSAGENCTNWKVHDNLFTASLAAHGGRISICTGAESLEFYNNTIDGVSGYMHLRGNNNHYHHNIIKGVRNSPLISRKTGFGICTFDDSWDGSTTNNIYENNIIMDCENAGIYLRGSSSYVTDGNIFRNNILIDNGVGSLNLGLWIEDYSGSGDRVKNNTFDNNLFYQEGYTGTLVNIYGHGKTMAQFNAFTDYGFSVSDNLRGDPLFVDSDNGDYHLESGSPAIDNGTTPLATLDYEGNPIPYSGTPADIGIYEYSEDSYANATDFYVSDSEGDDANDGLTESTPWKTIGKLVSSDSLFKAGVVIHLKRGDVWYGQSLTIRTSGEAGNPITYTSYGTGDLPEICAMATFDNSEISWTNKGSNIWETTINAAVIGSTWNQYFNLERLYINDSEVLGTPTVGNVGTTVPDRVVFNYNKSTQLLTLYSAVDPSTLKIECSYAQFAVSISHIEYVDIENIKITGGNIYGVSLRDSKNINFTNLDLGEGAYTALYIGDISDNISENIVIDSCKIDGRYDFDFSTSSSYNRGPKYGIWGRFSDNIEIKNSTFNNFTNASLRLEDYSAGENCTNYKVHNNLFTASLAAHGGRISICTGAESLEFYNNTIDGVSGYMHLRGNNNHYHHNIIKGVRNSPLISRKTGFGICTFDDGWDGSTTNNIYENNIIMDCENAGIYLRGSSSYNTDGNTFRNNILINNGVGSLNLGLWIEDYSGSGDRVKNNTFDNNLFYQEGYTGTLVNIYGHGKTMAQFNAFTDYGFSVNDNLRGDPLFVDSDNGDYHLQSGSPAIDNGTTPLATIDYEGNPIPYISTLPDIGIYETDAGLVLAVSPSSRSVGAASGTTTFAVASNVNWSVSESSNWLTATKIDATTLYVAFVENISLDDRSANITVSGPGVTSQTVTVEQDGATPVLTVTPSSQTVSSLNGTITFTVASNVDWSVSDSSSWLTATKTDATTLTVTYDENTSINARSASITLSGPGVTSQTVTVNQNDATPQLTVSPASRSVNSESGTVTFSVISNVDWSVSESSSWLTATKTNATTLTVTYDENTDLDDRSASITLSGPGVTSQTVTVNQDGIIPVLTVSPSSQTVSTQAGTVTFTVTSNIDWSVSESSSWLTATKINATTLSVSYNENGSVDARSASITLSGTGVASKTVTVKQDGATPVLYALPSSKTVSTQAGTVTFTVISNVDWSVSESSDWLKATKIDATTLYISFDENTSLDDRSASITLSWNGVTSYTVTVDQDGVTPVLTVSPSSQSVGSESGTTTFTVTSNVDWSVSESSDWLTATKTDATTLTVSYDENTSIDARSASITLSGTGVTSQTVTVEQDGATPVLTVSPSSQSVGSESGTTTFTVTSNIDWSVSESSDWLTATKTDATTLTVSYDENTSVDARSASITLSGTGVTSQTVTVEQGGATPVLTVSPSSQSMGSGSGTTTFTVTSNVDWSVSESSDWLTATKTDATTLTVSYDENANEGARSAEITISGTGVSSISVTITQEGRTNVGAIINEFNNSTITVYPNPASDKLFIKSNNSIRQEILIKLFDSAGNLIYSSKKDGLSVNDIVDIDISSFTSGQYILQLNNGETIKIKKVIKK